MSRASAAHAGRAGRRCAALLPLTTAIWALIQLASLPTPSHAHTLLTDSNPADGATLEEPPSEIVLTFSQAPDAALSTVRVVDASGAEVDVGEAEPVPGEPTQLRFAVGELAEGTYTVTWRTTSGRDGHTAAGALAFGVRAPATRVGTVAAGPVSTPAPTPASVAGRWLFYAGVVLLLGAAAVGITVMRNPGTIPRAGLAAASAAAAVGVAVTIADKRATTQTSLGDLLSSPTGEKLTVQALAVLLSGAAVAWFFLRRNQPALLAVGGAASAAMLARALAGHANTSSVRWFTVATQWVHLVSVGVWIGGLVWLLLAMRQGDRGRGAGLARRFSWVAGWTLVAIAVSGGLRALDEVGAWGRLTGTDYGVTMLVKLGLVAVLVAIAASSQLRHLAAAAAGRIRGLSRAVRAEVAIGAGVLGVTALLTGFPPASSVAAAPDGVLAADNASTAASANTAAGCGRGSPDARYEVTVEPDPDPPQAEGTMLRLTVRRGSAPVEGAKVCVRANMPDMQHRGVSTATREVSPGRYEGRIVFSMTGGWVGSAVITPLGAQAVSVPVRFEVR